MSGWFDSNATTALEPRVLAAMQPWLTRAANASSLHRAGRLARNALDAARGEVATLCGAAPDQVVFTGGGTEACNLALKGALAGRAPGRILCSAVEHSAVLAPARALSRQGFTLELIPVDAECRVTPEALAARLGPDVRLVSVMWANNETGVVQDIPALAALARAQGALFHCDAAQAVGKVAVDFTASGAELLTLSAHKFHGPQGVGALVYDRALGLAPLIDGGGQERGLRSGTEAVAALVGFGAAAALAHAELASRQAMLRALCTRLESGLDRVPGLVRLATRAPRLPNTVSCAMHGVDGAAVQMGLDKQGFAVSTGSACASGKPSHVLAAMGVPAALAQAAIRISLGKDNTAAEVDALCAALLALNTALPRAAVDA